MSASWLYIVFGGCRPKPIKGLPLVNTAKMATHVLYFDSDLSGSVEYDESNGSYQLSYKFAQAIDFGEMAYARLLYASGLGNGPVAVTTDFTKPQPVNNGKSIALLGRSDMTNCWVPLASNYVPSSGMIKVFRADDVIPGDSFEDQIEVIIQVASQSWVFRCG